GLAGQPLTGHHSVRETRHRSTKLESAQREKRAQDADDPEAHYHLRLLPPDHFEMMMQGRAPEDAMRLRVLQVVALLSVLEDEPLQDYRDHFRDKDRTHERQHELRLEQNGNRP